MDRFSPSISAGLLCTWFCLMRADPDADIRERGWSQKKFFPALRASGGGGSPAFCFCHVFFEHAKYILDSVPIK